MTPEKFFQKKKIIVCCGSGGVGKTTLAASLGLQAALLGKKVIVLTIDPAKRLATAMGLDSLQSDPQEIHIPEELISEASDKKAGKLFAMMLDTKRTFDRLIEKYSTRPATREAILNNRLYQHLSSMIAGSQEYMAMEKLHEIYQEGKFDLILLDTPPTRHALDFLEAPKKMIHLTGNSLLKWFLNPTLFASRFGFGLIGKGAEKILSVFDRLAGLSFLHELAEMVSLIGDLLGGFQERAQSVYDLLRENFVGFLLVTSPASLSIQDALHFYQKIKEADLPFMGFVINRVHELSQNTPTKDIRDEDVEGLAPSLKAKVLEHLKNFNQLALGDEATIRLLKKTAGKNEIYLPIPIFSEDVHDLEGLRNVGLEMFSS